MTELSRWSEIEPILDRALDRPEEERRDFVAEACAGDPDLERRVLDLVDAAAKPSPLDDPICELDSTLAESATSLLGGTTRTGELLGAYRVIGLLGEGGMGRVFLAERADGQFERRVALKILASTLGGDAARQRFLRERQILAGLRHDHIAQLLDAGVADDGRPWFALEYVRGLPVTEHCRRSRLTRDERIALMLEACEAVAHAHRQGIVHRDLKPSNLLVGEAPESGYRLFVLDFGIARAAGVAELTATGDILGTPGYMSPEQARGAVESIDRRTDVFALGVVLYELLCDRRPFEGETPGEVLGAVVAADPPGPRTLVPDLPRDLETILLTCLEKVPERRYPSARALADDLRRYLDGEPIAARAPGIARRARQAIRRHPAAAGVAAAVLLSAAVGAEVWVRGRREARVQAEISRRYGAAAERMAAEIRHEHLAPLHDTGPARRKIETQLEALERELAAVPEALRPAGLTALGRGRLALGDAGRALAELEAAWGAGARSSEAASALAEAEVLRYASDRSAAEAIADPSLREARIASLAARSRNRAVELAELARAGGDAASSDLIDARIAYLEGDLDRAEQLAATAGTAVAWLYEAQLLLGEVAMARAGELRRSGRPDGIGGHLDRALAAFGEASRIGRSDPATHLRLCAAAATGLDLILHVIEADPDPIATTGAAACRAAALADPARAAIPEQEAALETVYARELSRRDRDPFAAIAAATAAAEKAIAMDERSANAHRRLGDALSFRAEFERERGLDSAAAVIASIRELELATSLGPTDPGVWNSLGLAHWEDVLRAQRRDEDYAVPARAAIAAFRQAVTLEPGYAYAWANLGSMHNKVAERAIETGEDAFASLDQARNAFGRALEIYPEYVTAVNNLGNVLYNLGEAKWAKNEDSRDEYARALVQFDRAVELKPDWFAPRFGQARAGLALAQSQVRQHQPPEAALETALANLRAALAIRDSIVQAQQLAGEIHLFHAEVERHGGRSPRAALDDARRTLGRLLELDRGAGADLARGLAAFERGAATGLYPTDTG